jgi:Fe-S cluster assembly ATP-binding protein|tara:strand:+ start:1194 stop:1889 length:696 start_codon:yes stop_codon:yes gene_type:complete
MLKVQNLKVSIGEIQILKGIDMKVPSGELHAIMGPNGSGKSTFCHALMGNPDYEQSGTIAIGDNDVSKLSQFERSSAGIFQSFQYPVGLPGVTLKEYVNEINPELSDEDISELAKKFNVEQFLSRDVNVDLSGGEKKRSELFQLAIKKPKVALLDEIDSGLDIDAIKSVSALINENRNKETSYILVTHYSRILKYLDVDQVHIVVKGNIIKSGSEDLIEEVDSNGYTQYQE